MSEDSGFKYTTRTDEEIRALALDIVGGRVFGTWSHPDAMHSFMAMMLMDRAQHEELQRCDIAHIYEYLDKSNNLCVNGLPTFFSMKVLDKTDAGRLGIEVQRAQEMQKAFMAGPQ